jgi:hypothetical protein
MNTARTFTVITLAIALAGCGVDSGGSDYESRWKNSSDRDWAGPELWANRLQDWQVRGGRLECVGRLPMRTVHLLTHRIGPRQGDFRLSVRLGATDTPDAGISSAGFLIGAGPDLDYRAAALIHHSSGASAGLYFGVDTEGRLFYMDLAQEEPAAEWLSDERVDPSGAITLILSGEQASDGRVMLELFAAGDGATADTIKSGIGFGSRAAPRLDGSIALVSHTGPDGTTGFWFDSWTAQGSRLEHDPTRLAGPIIGSQHTLSRGTLKLTAQLMPIGPEDEHLVKLQVKRGPLWRTIDTRDVMVPGYTATFQIEDWDSSRDVPYRLAYELGNADGTSRSYHTGGTIRRDPTDKEEIVVAAFTGNHNVSHPGVDRGRFPWNWGVWFPHSDIVAHVVAQKPDFLFFSGDQVYEGASPTRADVAHLQEDYLYKWYLWYWAFGELTADIPSVTIPDDHDVYHGNIWGASGIATPPGLSGAAAQDAGGYKHPAEWVNMVQRTQTSHLPDPYDPAPVEQDIGVYFTDVLYGGVSFAVVEDRKFKSAPAALLPDGGVWNGWPQNPDFDPKTEADAPGAVLLGDRQLAFLEDWANDWGDGAWMKVLLSQTVFANVATLPEGATNGSVIPSLEILDRALRAMRKGFAVHLAGDQHLASTIRYGVDEWGDAGYALCVPSIANFWPRRWFPPEPGADHVAGSPRYTGDYEDGFGNKMTVFAVSNPLRYGAEPAGLHERAPGYGIARFNRSARTISLAAWPRWADPDAGDEPYPGWPVAFSQADNYARAPAAYLPRLSIQGMSDAVVQVVSEDSGEIIYTLRISGNEFTPALFEDGSYTVHVGEPGTTRMRTLTGIRSATQPGETIEITIP